MYNLRSFGQMISDRVRIEAYASALQKAIFPGAIVVEIGAATGFFSLMACRFGARRVYAIETNDAITVAVQAAAANGYSDRIQFFQQISTKVELPEKADVLISDLRGGTPLHSLHIPSIVDGRTRFLKPGGVQLPVRDDVFAALVASPKFWKEELDPWERDLDGFDWSPARRVMLNQWWKASVAAHDLLSPSLPLLSIDYTVISNPSVAGSVSLTPSAAGVVYGFALSFDAEIFQGIGFTTRPGQPGAVVYGPAFFPLESPLPVTENDSVTLDLRADLVGSEYVWTWKTSLNGQLKLVQSTFKANLTSPKAFHQASSSYHPSLNVEGRAVRWILQNMNGANTNSQLAAGLLSAFPGQFASAQAALRLVAAIVLDYDDAERECPSPGQLP